jgi:hypothetical protein
MIGSQIRGRSIAGANVEGVVCDKVNVPVPMKVPDGTIAGMDTIVPCDCYVILSANQQTHLVPVTAMQIMQVATGRPKQVAPAAAGKVTGADDEDEADLDIIKAAQNA